MGLSENSDLNVKIENESGKSSEIPSFINRNKTYLRYVPLAKSIGVVFSDSPCIHCKHSQARHTPVS